MLIEPEHLQIASDMITDLEPDMQFVFSKIGRTDASIHAEKLIALVHARGKVSWPEAYRQVHQYFPSMRDFEDVVTGCVRAGFIKMGAENGEMWMVAGVALATAVNGTILRA